MFLGEFAAIFTSATFAINSAIFTLAGREVGSAVVNRLRLIVATLLLMAAQWIFLGIPWPAGVEFDRWVWLGLSGFAGLVVGDAFLSPFLGVSLSLFALQHTSVGVASTLMALPPVFILPIEYFYFKERFGWGAIAGTVVAMLGVAVLFLV